MGDNTKSRGDMAVARGIRRPAGFVWRGLGVTCVVLVIGLAVGPEVSATEPLQRAAAPDPSKPTSSPEARKSAIESIPFEKLDSNGQARVSAVLANTSLYRRMPVQIIQCDPDLYLFLVEHPDVVVNIWDVLGITQTQMQQTGPTQFGMVDAAGTKGSVEYLYRSHDTHVIYTEGSYDGPLFVNPIAGRGLLILKTGYVREPNGRYYVTSRMDVFMQVQHAGVDLLAKAFQPLVGKVADVNFAYTAGFLGSLSRTAEANQEGMQRLADRLSKVQPDVRRQFAQLAGQVAQRASELPPLVQPLLAERQDVKGHTR